MSLNRWHDSAQRNGLKCHARYCQNLQTRQPVADQMDAALRQYLFDRVGYLACTSTGYARVRTEWFLAGGTTGNSTTAAAMSSNKPDIMQSVDGHLNSSADTAATGSGTTAGTAGRGILNR